MNQIIQKKCDDREKNGNENEKEKKKRKFSVRGGITR